MSDITPPNGTPKDINNRLGGVKGLNPDDPNATAFKLVTILCILSCQKNSPFFPIFCEQHNLPPPPNVLSQSIILPPALLLTSPPLGGRVSGTGNRSHSSNRCYV
jgi:hypothetical protein